MENKKHIFASHISEIGEKNQKLEQNLNVINEMADGGNVPNNGSLLLKVNKVYKVKDFNIKNDAVALSFKTFKIKEFEVYEIDKTNNVYYIQIPNFNGSIQGMFKLDFSEIKAKDSLGELEVDKVYKIKDFTFSGDGQNMMDTVYKKNYPNQDEFKVFRIQKNPLQYFIEQPTYQGTMPYYLLATDVKFNFNTLFNNTNSQKPKYPTIASLSKGKTYDINNFDFVGMEGESFESSLKSDNTDKFEVYKVLSKTKTYYIKSLGMSKSDYVEIDFKDVLELKNQLNIGDKIRVSDYVFFNYTANFNLIERKVQQVEIVDIEDSENYVFQDDEGNKYYVYLSGLLLAPNPRLENGQIIDFSKYQIINNATSKNIRQDNLTEGKLFTPETAPYLVIESTGAVIDLEKKSIAEISAFPKFEYQIGDEIEIGKIDISQGRGKELDLMESLGYKSYKVIGFLPMEDANGYFYEVVVGKTTPYHYNLIPTNKVEPKAQPTIQPQPIQPTIQSTPKLEDLNLQPATQNTPNPSTEKFNFSTASQNFIQQNIIGENILFTPKFVLLESLMELNELTKGKEKDLSNDLESIINDIDSFVIDQCAITPNDNSCGQVPQNIQSTPTTKSKSKKSKPMPNMDIDSLLNNPNLPEEARDMLLRGINSGNMNRFNG